MGQHRRRRATAVAAFSTRRCVVWWCWWRAATQIIFPQRPGNGTSPRGVCAVLCGRFHYGVTGDLRFLRQTEYILNARAAQPSRFSVLQPHSLCATSIPSGSSVVVT